MRWRSARVARARAARRRARSTWQRSVRFHQARYEAATGPEDRVAAAFDWFRSFAGSGQAAGEAAQSLAAMAVALWDVGGPWSETAEARLERHQARYQGATGDAERLRVAFSWYRAEVCALRHMFDEYGPDFQRTLASEWNATADYLAGQASQLARSAAPSRAA